MGRIDTTVNAELWQPTFLAQKLQNIELVRKFFFFYPFLDGVYNLQPTMPFIRSALNFLISF